MQNRLLVIAGGSQGFRSDLCEALKTSTEIDVIQEAQDDVELRSIASRNLIAVLLLDAAWQTKGQEPSLRKLYGLGTRTRCIVFSNKLTQNTVRSALIRGAHGCLTPNSSVEDWRNAIQTVSCDGIWFPQQLLSDALVSEVRRPHKTTVVGKNKLSLTTREREIRECVTEGMTNKEIARWLGISPTTVKTHLQHMFGKLNVNHRVLLLRDSDAQVL